MKKTLFIIVFLFFILISSKVFASTYYIDYIDGSDGQNGLSKATPWKRVPGMVGFTGNYVHSPGDIFILKGGVIWPSAALPFIISYSGTSGNIDTYTTDHTWFRGVVWTQPVLDGEHGLKQLLFAGKKSYFTINDIKFVDYGTAGVYNGGKGMEIKNSSHYTISNCTISPQAWIGLYLYSISGSSESYIRIHNNDISSSGQAIVLTTAAPNTTIDDIHIYNNDIHDLTSQIVGATHGDAIHSWNSPDFDATQVISNLKIYNNNFYGDFSRTGTETASMTALIYLSDGGIGHEIYNNILTYSKRTDFVALISVKIGSNHKIYNNTLYLPPSEGGEIAINVGPSLTSNVRIENNIIAGAQFAYNITNDAISGIKIDHNCINITSDSPGSWGGGFKNWTEWQALGNDVHSIIKDPLFVSTADFHLKAGSSPCIDAGTNLSSVFLTDKDGKARTDAWDIGAYEIITVPANPTILQLQ